MSYNKSSNYDSSSTTYHHNSDKYIPRERDDRHRDGPVTNPSICIPRTFTTIRGEQTKRAVFNTFRDLRVGHIDRIDTVHKTDQRGERYCTVYIHLKWNMANSLARETRQKLLDGQDIKVVYDEPWFWKCTMSNVEKPDDRNPRKANTSSRPRIDLGEGVRALSRDPRDDYRERDHDDVPVRETSQSQEHQSSGDMEHDECDD